MKTDNKALIEALRILSRDIVTQDGVANAAIAEGADQIERLLEMIYNLNGMIKSMDSIIDKLVKKVDWISCDEEMPPSNIMVIVQGGCAYYKNDEWISAISDRPIEWDVTHWMPFPHLPLPEGTEGL